MWGKALDWLLFLMTYDLVLCEPFVLKPVCQPPVITEMPPLFSAPLDGILLHTPMGGVLPKKFLLPIMVAESKHCDCFGS